MRVSYVALVEEGSDEWAFGVIFPDLPGCFSAGDTFEEAVKNAGEALGAFCELSLERGKLLPSPRALEVIARDPEVKAEFAGVTHRFVSVVADVPQLDTYGRNVDAPGSASTGFEESAD